MYQVRIRTTPSPFIGSLFAAAIVGAVFVLAANYHAGLTVTPPSPVPSVTATATPHPSTTPAVVAARPTSRPGVVKAPEGSGLPGGGTYILGIYVPPPGT